MEETQNLNSIECSYHYSGDVFKKNIYVSVKKGKFKMYLIQIIQRIQVEREISEYQNY